MRTWLITLASIVFASGGVHAQWSLELPKPVRNTPLDPNTWKIPQNEVKFYGDIQAAQPPHGKFVTGCGAVLKQVNGRQWNLIYDNNGGTVPFYYEGSKFMGRGNGYIQVFRFNGTGTPPFTINMLTISSWSGAKDSQGKPVDRQWNCALSKYQANEGDHIAHFHDGWWGKWVP